jgi:hypothetical protein
VNKYNFFIFEWRHSAWTASLVVLMVNVLSISWFDTLNESPEFLGFISHEHLLGQVLLICLIPSWIIGAFIVAQRRSVECMAIIDKSLPEHLHTLPKFKQPPVRYIGVGLIAALVYALSFNVPTRLLSGLLDGEMRFFSITVGQTFIWLMVGYLLANRLHSALIMNDAGKHVPVDIFEQSVLNPFVRSVLIDIVTITGALAVSAVQSIDAQFRLDNYLNAFSVAIPAGTLLLMLSMWSLHSRLRADKQALLTDVLGQIRSCSKKTSSSDMQSLETLLTRKDRVIALSTWPINISTWVRLVIYLMIPLLTWFGTTLIEVVFDKLA